jgi:hypothetical protein
MAQRTVDASAGGPAGAASGTGRSEALAPALTRPARRLVEAIAGGAQRYLERWEDLVHEAKAARDGGAEEPDVAGALAGLSGAKAESDTPGRLRLRLTQLRGHGRLAGEVARTLEGHEGVKRVDVSARTGSVLLLYDPQRYATGEALQRTIAAPAKGPARRRRRA